MTCTRKNTIWDAITLVMLHVESLCVDELKFIDKNVIDHLKCVSINENACKLA